jgi:hypothetical protein
MKLYKLTEQDETTYCKSMSWKVGKTNRVKKCNNPKLCSGDVIHAYKNKNLALLLNPQHAHIKKPLMFECSGKVVVEDWGKIGVFSLKCEKKMRLPKWHTDENKCRRVVVMFAVLCAESVIKIYEDKYPGDNRPRKAIEAAKEYLKSGKNAARAARAAHAAADAAHVADADARAAADAAYVAAADAAHAAADAAYAAYVAEADKIDFCKLADKAVKIIKSGVIR